MDDEKEFIIFSLKRLDLVTMGISQERVEQLSDEEIEKIVAEIRALYHKTDIQGAIELLTKMHFVFDKTE